MKLRIRTSVICLHQDTLLVFKAVDPTSHENYWFLPGGKIEDRETPWACVERETLEETGYCIRAHQDSEIIKEYFHWWDGVENSCKTFFYKGTLVEPWHEPIAVVDAAYNKGAIWLPVKEALEFFTYKKEIHEAVMELIKWQDSKPARL